MFKRILAIVTACMLMLTAVAFGEAVPAGVTGEFTGVAKGMGGDVTVTIGLMNRRNRLLHGGRPQRNARYRR